MSIEVRALAKKYKDFSIDIDLTVGSDEILVLAGPSGCGKTTALQMIAGLVKPDSGEVLVDGKNVVEVPAWKRGIGIVFQDLALFPHLSVGGNVAYGPLIAGADKKRRKEIVASCLSAVRLSGFESRGVDTLSGGERQRVAIARALAAEPKALLMDEPFSSLDAPLRRALRAEFRELRLREGFPCVFVTHDREEAAAVADRIAVMDGGRVIESGTSTQLFNEPKTAFAARFLGAGSVVPASIIRSVLGKAPLPFSAAENSSLLIPPDALTIVGVDDNAASCRARITESVFEGSCTNVGLETGTGAEAVALRATLDRRAGIPHAGETVGVKIDWELARLVANANG